MRKVLMISIMFFIATMLYARYSTAIFSEKAFDTATEFADSTEQFSLDYERYVSYALYSADTDMNIEVQAQGKVGGEWVTFKRDTLGDSDVLLDVELRNSTTDYMKGVNIGRLYMTIEPDAADTTGTYSLQVTAR